MTRESHDGLRDYFVAISRHPLLTATEELTLGKQVAELQRIVDNGGPRTKDERHAVRRGERAKKRFVSANLRLVVTIAKHYKRVSHCLDMLDLIQEGNLGLVRAVERFDYTRGYKFSTYSYWWISQAMRRALQRSDRPIKLPSQIAEIARRLPSIRHKESIRLGREPSLRELAAACKMSEDELRLLLDRNTGITTSLDLLITQEDSVGSTLLDLVYDKEHAQDQDNDLALQHDLSRMRKAFVLLTDKEQELLMSRYGINEEQQTYASIGRRLGLSRERTRQMASTSLNKLRYLMEVESSHSEERSCA